MSAQNRIAFGCDGIGFLHATFELTSCLGVSRGVLIFDSVAVMTSAICGWMVWRGHLVMSEPAKGWMLWTAGIAVALLGEITLDSTGAA